MRGGARTGQCEKAAVREWVGGKKEEKEKRKKRKRKEEETLVADSNMAVAVGQCCPR